MTRSPVVSLLSIMLVLATLLTVHLLPQLASVLMLLFAGVILAVLLDAVTTTLSRVLPGGRLVSYLSTLLGIALLLAGIGTLIAPRISQEAPQLMQGLPAAWDSLSTQLKDYPMTQALLARPGSPFENFSAAGELFGLVSSSFSALFNCFVIVIVGIYGAVAPERYLDAVRRLLPASKREQARDLTAQLGHELRYWLLGRSVSMAIVGVATGIGLWLLGVPLAFTLGALAGLLSFVPYLGPVLALLPALLMAAVESFALAGWVLLLYGSVQLLESTLITPLIQQRAIALPPAVLVAVQLIGGVLVGPTGVLFAAPLVVTSLTIVRWSQATNDDASAKVVTKPVE